MELASHIVQHCPILSYLVLWRVLKREREGKRETIMVLTVEKGSGKDNEMLVLLHACVQVNAGKCTGG